MVQADMRDCGLPVRTEHGIRAFHSLRNSFISGLFDSGVDVPTIQRLARHATPSMTLSYARLRPNSERLAIDQIKLPGLSGSTQSITQSKERRSGAGVCGRPEKRSIPDKARTCNLRLRRPTLYPIELRGLVADRQNCDRIGWRRYGITYCICQRLARIDDLLVIPDEEGGFREESSYRWRVGTFDDESALRLIPQ